MKTVSFSAFCVSLVVVVVCAKAQVGFAIDVDFEDLTLAPESAAPGDSSETPFESHGVSFNRTWQYGFPGAWAYSNQTDLTTAGYTNPYSAYHLPSGGGVEGSDNFAVAFNPEPGHSIITLPAPAVVDGAYFSNTTYAFLSMANGDSFAKKFGGEDGTDPDWFLLTITGRDVQGDPTGTVDFYLADFRSTDSQLDYIVNTWTWVDMTSLGSEVKTLDFTLDSTDVGDFGLNTPTYFAMDNLAVTVPGDMNGDGVLDSDDVGPFVLSLTNRALYESTYPLVDVERAGDVDGSGTFDLGDVAALDELLGSSTATANVPEPASGMLMLVAGSWLLVAGRKSFVARCQFLVRA